MPIIKHGTIPIKIFIDFLLEIEVYNDIQTVLLGNGQPGVKEIPNFHTYQELYYITESRMGVIHFDEMTFWVMDNEQPFYSRTVYIKNVFSLSPLPKDILNLEFEKLMMEIA